MNTSKKTARSKQLTGSAKPKRIETRQQVIHAKSKDLPQPQNTAEAAVVVTLQYVEEFAKGMKREQEFEQDKHHKSYLAAFGNYHTVFWTWIRSHTPDDVAGLLNKRLAVPDTVKNKGDISVLAHRYLVWRAIFVAGMHVGEGFNPNHYRHFAKMAEIANTLDDKGIFKTACQHRNTAKPPKHGYLHGATKFRLIIDWLAGGLWKASSREEQCALFFDYHGRRPTTEEIQKAQKRLGLVWPL